MKSLPCLLATLIILALPLSTVAANPAFNGRWKLDTAKSTSLDPWGALEIEIAVNGDQVSLVRHYSAGPRKANETIQLDMTAGTQIVTVEGWWDNKHIDAWIGNGGKIEVTPQWLDRDLTLQLNINMVLESQQGDYPVRVLRELRLSPDGKTLREIQIRSSRKLPVVQVFHKI